MKTVKNMGKVSIIDTIKYNTPNKKKKSAAYKPTRKAYNPFK